MSERGYAHPELLVDTAWAADHLQDPHVRFVEVDVDTSAYEQGHIPGAVGWNWKRDTQDMIRRDIVDREAFEKLLSRSGISKDTTVVLYGDSDNCLLRSPTGSWTTTAIPTPACWMAAGRSGWKRAGR